MVLSPVIKIIWPWERGLHINVHWSVKFANRVTLSTHLNDSRHRKVVENNFFFPLSGVLTTATSIFMSWNLDKKQEPRSQMLLHPLTNFCSLLTNNYIPSRGQTGEGKDDPGLLYHQPATEELSQPSFTELTGCRIHDTRWVIVIQSVTAQQTQPG